MTANSIIEYILVFFGWVLNNAMWNIIFGTGLYLLPLVFKCTAVWLKTREEGFDEGNKGLLLQPRLEHALYVPYLVILFCVLPVVPVDISAMKFDSSRAKQCHVSVATPQTSGYSSVVNDLGGKTANISVWWYLIHRLSKGVTQAMTASIPCGGQIRQLRFEVQQSQLRDPMLAQELQEFANSCYARAYYRLKKSNPSLTDKTINSVGWIGSDYFMNTEGYYDTYTSKQPKKAWRWDEKRDAGYANTGDGGYPTCKQWWLDAKKGLKDRVLASMSPKVTNDLRRQVGKDWEETALRWLVSPQNVRRSIGNDTYILGSNDNPQGGAAVATRLDMTVGATLKQLDSQPGFDALKLALPIVQALLEMMVIVSIPVLLMFSAYDPKTIVTITFAQFALIFISFWWEVAGWLDDKLLIMTYDSITNFTKSVNDGWIMNIVLGTMYMVFPMGWFAMISWTGVAIGNLINNGISDTGKISQDIGKEGGGIVKGAGKSVITKGMKK
ncbi:conjugal transfer protein TraG [Salmonella enterica]|uniref:Conjugal transfer protein TraG n=2 Tax=Salmonella enterica TaxID=28901 RepID=A0A403T279_SALER|nr:conjugal transfer protein TraG N-terminal domain-containing protein [Salmonella sp. SG203]EAB7739621.1 conjugal transfer protein TraG [Salmonella enterica subsp. enterica serovar Hadar]EAV6575342.1 conjugal transfer protein TraG [Salmonella enterica]EBQ9003685.1 conjugal transfer protein TraG [Salmonella enterica subsp. enterica serovar Blockley]EBR8259015.1 conjugal transfer protein TraG [Salmonella enterica subsp. enterica serovar Cerro]EBW7251933.1 conjugal transfer protein TraG [Salmone